MDLLKKHILRKQFDCVGEDGKPYLPKEVLWRQKEQFSDGVGYNWIDQLIDHASEQVTDVQMETAATRFPVNTPTSKEAYFYREIFQQHFPQDSAAKTVKRWIPKWQKDLDPSGRANETHVAPGMKKVAV